MKKRLLILFTVLFMFTLVACNNDTKPELKSDDIKETVHAYSVGQFDNVTASITSHELIVKDHEENTTSYPLPSDEFFVSIAPFIEYTHECAIHSLTGCQGELVEKEFDVYIEDENGTIVMDEKMTSLENGFIDLWLPRDQNFQVEITHEGKTVESTISTFEGDNTCITTMHLT